MPSLLEATAADYAALRERHAVRGADRDDLVGVDALVGLLAREALHQVGDGGHAGGAAHEDDVVELALADAGVLERLLERHAAALDEVGGHLLELGPGEVLVEVQREIGRASCRERVSSPV